MTKILDYNQRIYRSNFIDGNQCLIGDFTPVDENYTGSLATVAVAKNVIDRMRMPFLFRPLEKRLVMSEGKIVGTFEISDSVPLALYSKSSSLGSQCR